MAAALGFPFTSAQRKELERQAMIYMYMVSSVPVPPHLLLPLAPSLYTTDPTASLGNGSIFDLNQRFCNDKDPEPGRCKRTDGKKWRCSRDVAPHQKYCERHLHRSRSRSRKPVEVHHPFNSNDKKKTRVHHHTVPPNPTSISSPQLLGSTIQPNEIFLDDKPDESLSVSPYEEPNRGLDWTMEPEMLTMDASEQQRQHLSPTNIGLTTEGSIYNTSSSVFRQDCIEEPLNLIPYTDFGAPEVDQQNGESILFLNPDLVCLGKQSLMETTRGFIDAWSNEDTNINHKNECSVSSQGNLLPSSLTLSMAMAAGNALDEEMGLIQMGLGATESDHHEPQVSSWVSPVSWVGSTPGGPLAEVLRQSSIAVSSDPASSYAFNGNSFSNPATRVSSPSGVLQRTMLSPSDSSGCTSPSIAASTATPEVMPFQWLS